MSLFEVSKMTSIPSTLKVYLTAELNYACTNESLPSIIEGMEPRETDRILAICGSGDQAFALLESGAHVVAIDNDVHQVEFAQKRREKLKSSDYAGFLHAPPARNSCDPIARDIYFREGERMRNIRARLGNLDIRSQDIRTLNEMVDKAYLSNVFDWINDQSTVELVQLLAAHVSQGGLVYLADKAPIKERKTEWQEFEVDARLTERAASLTYYGDTSWVPRVMRRCH